MRELLTPWAVAAVVAFLLGVIMDASSWGTTAWGTSTSQDKDISVGLWRICNITKERDGTLTEVCVFPTEIDQDWIPKALVMEIMAGFCGIGIFFTVLIFIFTLRLDWMRSRFILVALMAEALLAGLFNFIGLVTIAVNLGSLGAHPDYSIVFEVLGIICFFSGCVFGVCDMQKCCMKKPDDAATMKLTGPATRPI